MLFFCSNDMNREKNSNMKNQKENERKKVKKKLDEILLATLLQCWCHITKKKQLSNRQTTQKFPTQQPRKIDGNPRKIYNKHVICLQYELKLLNKFD